VVRHTTHLVNEELPEPGTLRRVVSVHPGNRSYETVPVGHDPGWLVADPGGTNSLYVTDDEVDEVHPSGQWLRAGGVPAAIISRHGARPEPEQVPVRRYRRGRPRPPVDAEGVQGEPPSEPTGADTANAAPQVDFTATVAGTTGTTESEASGDDA
jgi:hypothetical protein